MLFGTESNTIMTEDLPGLLLLAARYHTNFNKKQQKLLDNNSHITNNEIKCTKLVKQTKTCFDYQLTV